MRLRFLLRTSTSQSSDCDPEGCHFQHLRNAAPLNRYDADELAIAPQLLARRPPGLVGEYRLGPVEGFLHELLIGDQYLNPARQPLYMLVDEVRHKELSFHFGLTAFDDMQTILIRPDFIATWSIFRKQPGQRTIQGEYHLIEKWLPVAGTQIG